MLTLLKTGTTFILKESQAIWRHGGSETPWPQMKEGTESKIIHENMVSILIRLAKRWKAGGANARLRGKKTVTSELGLIAKIVQIYNKIFE